MVKNGVVSKYDYKNGRFRLKDFCELYQTPKRGRRRKNLPKHTFRKRKSSTYKYNCVFPFKLNTQSVYNQCKLKILTYKYIIQMRLHNMCRWSGHALRHSDTVIHCTDLMISAHCHLTISINSETLINIYILKMAWFNEQLTIFQFFLLILWILIHKDLRFNHSENSHPAYDHLRSIRGCFSDRWNNISILDTRYSYILYIINRRSYGCQTVRIIISSVV